MRKCLLLLILLLRARSLFAEDLVSTTCPGTGCVDYNVSSQGSIGIQITGTWSGTITFKSSIDGTTFVSLGVVSVADTTAAKVLTTTANGTFQATVAGLRTVRVHFTTRASGTATISARMTTVAGKFGVGGSSSTGTVTSVDLTVPAIFSVTGNPVTTSGTLALALATQTTNKVFAAPNGSTGVPTFRALVAADMPAILGSMSAPLLIGTLTDATAFGYGVTAIYVQGNYAYATIGHGNSSLTGIKHFVIVDISNRLVPRLVGSLPATGDAYDSFALTVYGNYAFVGNNSGTNHLEIINISNPTVPTIEGISTDSKLDFLAGLAVQGHYLYAGGATDHRLVIVDIVDSSTPIVVGSVQDATKLSLPIGVAVQGNYAYVVGDNSTGWINVINIEDPTAPTIVGSVSSATTLSSPAAIAVVGSYVYVCRGNTDFEGSKKTFSVVDVSNPASPAVASSYRSSTDISGIGGCNSLAASWPYVAVSGYAEDGSTNAVTVLNVAVPTSTPVLVTNLAVDPWGSGTAGYIAWVGRNLLVSTYEPSLNVLSIGGSFLPTLDVGSLNVGFGHVADSLIVSNYLSVGSGIQVGERGINSQGPIGGSSLSINGGGIFSGLVGDKLPVCFSTGGVLYAGTNTAGVLACP